MTKPARKMGRPPSDEPRKVQVFSFLPPDDAAWFMGLPPKQRSAWLAAHIAADRTRFSPNSDDTRPHTNPDDPPSAS